MKKYRSFSVDVVANGFIASIGCQRLVFKTMEEVSEKKILENSFTDAPMLEVAEGSGGGNMIGLLGAQIKTDTY